MEVLGKETPFFVYGGTALTMDPTGRILEDCVIEIREGKIASIESRPGFSPKGQSSLSVRDCLVLPGLVNGHTHAGMSLLRGVADDLPLHRWLFEEIFPREKKWSSPEFVHIGTLLACLEMIRSGITTFNDMYYLEEHAAKAVDESGLRAICGQAVVEIGGVANPQSRIFEELDEFLEKIKSFPRVMPAIAPHSVYGVSRETLIKVMEFASQRGLLIHIHLSETDEEVKECFEKHKKSPPEYFEELGLWSHRVVAAHGVCLTERDIQILGNHHVGIIHNPKSNLKLGTKLSPVCELRAAGAHVGLGTDSVASNNNLDLFEEASLAARIQAFRRGAGALKAQEWVQMLTIEGAHALGLGDTIGSIEVGKEADLIAIELIKPHLLPIYNPYSHLVYAAKGSDVRHVVVGGKVVMEDYQVRSLDEKAVLNEVAQWGRKIASTK